MRAVFLDRATVDAGDLDFSRLNAIAPGIEYFDTCDARQVLSRVANAELIVTNKVALNQKVIDAAPALKCICLIATGVDNVDQMAAKARGIAVYNIRDYCSTSVAQHVFAMILGLNRHLEAYGALLRAGSWKQSPQFCMLDYSIDELDGKVLGIVGYGVLGRAVARIGRAFGMQVLASTGDGQQPDDENVLVTSREALLAQADVVSLHCPLNADTRHMINAESLKQMKPTALLINTARGGLVDSRALADALINNTIGGAGIDVLEKEPPVDYDPLLDSTVPRLIVTPHVAWASVQARQRALDSVVDNIRSWQTGGGLNRIV